MLFKKKSIYNWLVVGLGNPGPKYENTRHNIGFAAVDKFAADENFRFDRRKSEAVIGECKLGTERVLIIKPQTFMNNSGRAVSAIANFYRIASDRIIVIFDDVSLSVGDIRIRRKGSHGGHNGMRDITQFLGTDDILRIKIGVGAKPRPDYDLASWVLGKFPKEQEKDVIKSIDKTILSIREIILCSVDSAMNKYNS